MKKLTLEETRLKEEMKERCLAKGQYKDEKAKDKFKMLCHLEDFMIQYWELLKQQKEFTKYMNDIIEDLETEDVDDEEMKAYLIQRIDTFKEILQKYREIIGVSDENNMGKSK